MLFSRRGCFFLFFFLLSLVADVVYGKPIAKVINWRGTASSYEPIVKEKLSDLLDFKSNEYEGEVYFLIVAGNLNRVTARFDSRRNQKLFLDNAKENIFISFSNEVRGSERDLASLDWTHKGKGNAFFATFDFEKMDWAGSEIANDVWYGMRDFVTKKTSKIEDDITFYKKARDKAIKNFKKQQEKYNKSISKDYELESNLELEYYKASKEYRDDSVKLEIKKVKKRIERNLGQRERSIKRFKEAIDKADEMLVLLGG